MLIREYDLIVDFGRGELAVDSVQLKVPVYPLATRQIPTAIRPV